jgi:hypothetical protein
MREDVGQALAIDASSTMEDRPEAVLDEWVEGSPWAKVTFQK